MKITRPTNKDFVKLKAEEMKIYDNRSYYEYIWIQITQNHPLFNTFWTFSLINPFFIRIIGFYTKIGLNFGILAFTFTDNAIKEIHVYN